MDRVVAADKIDGNAVYTRTGDSLGIVEQLMVDKISGKIVWETNMMFGEPELRLTSAPLAIKDKLIVGAAGGDRGVRDWIAGLDAASGKVLWRKYTIPAPG